MGDLPMLVARLSLNTLDYGQIKEEALKREEQPMSERLSEELGSYGVLKMTNNFHNGRVDSSRHDVSS
jgi:hypothetical protein